MKKVFIGGLPKHVNDEKLRDMFSSYGEITDYVVMKDPHSKESRGFGFIEFSSEEPVNQIIQSRPHMIDSREIEVRRAMPKDITHNTIHERTKRVFIGGINYDVTEDDLRNHYNEKFSKYGRVDSVEVKRDRETNHSRGFAFVTFDSEDTVDAVLILESKPTIFGRNCEVKKSEPRRSDEPPKRSSRPRRRSPYPSHRYEYDDDYSRYSRRDEFDRPRRSERYPPESRPLIDYPSHSSYKNERPYERSPVYRRYPHQEPPSSGYGPETSSYDRSYPYSDYYNSYQSSYYSPVYDKGTSTRSIQPSSGQAPSSSRSGYSNYPSRVNSQYRHYDSSMYRDRDTNPY